MVSLGPFSNPDQDHSDNRSASVKRILNLGYIIRICNLNNYNHDYEDGLKLAIYLCGQFCTYKFTRKNIYEEPDIWW